MLKRLKIQNLVLVEKADVVFGEGLNIITGETGSGKSAFLSAIGLIAGDRADAQLIGKGGDLALVEASLSLGEIRREIHRSGKSRCFFDDQLVSLSELREIAAPFIERIDQSSAAELCSLEEQRKMLDSFAEASEEAKRMAAAFSQEQEDERALQELEAAQEMRSRDLAWAEEDLAIIDEVNWKRGEEEEIAEAHRILSSAQELHEKIGELLTSLDGAAVKRAASLLEAASRLDPALSSQAASLKSASLEIEESHHFLSSYLLKLEADPGRLSAVEERISSIERLKKRFGKTLEAVEAKKRELQERIEKLSHLDEQIQEMRERLEKRKGENRLLARELSEKRKRTAPPFAGAILAQLSSLNLPRAQFTVSISEKPLSSSGTDWVRFLFSANPGHSPIPLEECASGGELSRLLLAMKIVLAQKEKRSCFVFDEIDSNVGGQTASILGEKLKALSENKQVICVTHFAQVAKCAHHHFAVSKEEKKGRVFTSIAKLLSSEREIEYARMQGLQ